MQSGKWDKEPNQPSPTGTRGQQHGRLCVRAQPTLRASCPGRYRRFFFTPSSRRTPGSGLGFLRAEEEALGALMAEEAATAAAATAELLRSCRAQEQESTMSTNQ